MALFPIYTAGYSRHSADELKAKADALQAMLFDIRLSPNSLRPEWRKHHLLKLLGHRYRHVPAWGNLHYKTGGDIKIANWGEGLERLLRVRQIQSYRCIILLCACENPQLCHRSIVAGMLLRAEHGFVVQELEWKREEK
jgi:uncharacterized protein (DUF488 family)